MLRKGGIVSYLMDGIEIYRSTDTASGDSTLLLQASLYAGDDETDPVLRSLAPEFPADPELEITGTLSLASLSSGPPPAMAPARCRTLALPAQTTTFMSGGHHGTGLLAAEPDPASAADGWLCSGRYRYISIKQLGHPNQFTGNTEVDSFVFLR